MDIKEEDFPLYQLLKGVPGNVDAFERARLGGDKEKAQFAEGLKKVAIFASPQFVPGLTDEKIEKTFQSCEAVLNEVSARWQQKQRPKGPDLKRP